MSDQTNLLLITTDQQRRDTLSLYGVPGYRTPVLDGLARDGLCFDYAYCPSPISTPSRVSMLTGQYPSAHGAYTIGSAPRLDGPTLPAVLGKAGYATGMVGKTHFTSRRIEAKHCAGISDPKLGEDLSGDEANPPAEFWRTFDGPYLGFEFLRCGWGHTNERVPGEHYRVWLEDRGVNLDTSHRCHPCEPGRDEGRTAEKDVVASGHWSNIDEAHHQTAWITDESLNFINRARGGDRPWFCWTSYKDPHFPFVCPDPYYHSVDMTGVTWGSHTPGELDDKPPFYKSYYETGAWHDGTRDFFDGRSVPACRRDKWEAPPTDVQAYIGMCNMLDTYVGKIVAHLKSIGQYENTLIVFTSDHGEYLGHHGFWGKGLPAYDDAQKVPCIVHWPAGMKRTKKGRTESLFNLVDIPQTFLEVAGVDAPHGMQGVSQAPVLRGEERTVRTSSITECHATPNVYQTTFVKDGWKLVVYRDADYGELYHLAEDPQQMVNLWSKADHAARKADLLLDLAQATMQKDATLPSRLWGA